MPTLGGKINFSFMEKFIEELDAYLAVTGLKNYELTDAEKSAIKKFDEFNKWAVAKEFKIGDLFKIQTPKRKFDANKIQFGGQYPYVTRGDKNNGIRGYIDENIQYLNDENTISFGQDTATMFFQKNKYFTGDKIKIFIPINFNLNSNIANYIITSMRCGFSNFTWGSSSYNVEILKNVKIILPTNDSDEIDYEFMENFIKAIEKLVIKDVVLWADKKIEATKKVVNKA